MRSPRALDARRAMRLVLAYSLAHAALGAASLSAAATSADAYGISRAVLQLMSALSLLPSAAARRRRAPTLAALVAALALLVDAVLRTLAAVHQIMHGSGGLRSSPRYASVAGTQAFLSLAAAASAAPRALPFLQGIERKRRPPRSPSTQQQLSSGRRRQALEETSAVDLGTLMVMLHAVSCVAARGGDVFAALGQPNAIWPAFVDACAAFLFINLLLAPTKMLCRILLQATPDRLVSSLRSRLDNVLAIDGVVGLAHAHFWEETPGVCIGAVALAVSNGVKSNVVVPSVRQVFGTTVEKLTIQIEEVAQNEVSAAALSSDTVQTSLPVS